VQILIEPVHEVSTGAEAIGPSWASIEVAVKINPVATARGTGYTDTKFFPLPLGEE